MDNTIRLWSTTTGIEIACFHHISEFLDIHIAADQQSIITTSSTSSGEKIVLQHALPQGLWPKDDSTTHYLQWFDLSTVQEDGWVYSKTSGNRIFWVPVRLRDSFKKVYQKNGCLLAIKNKDQMLYISQL
jgi:hypothetical protein